MATTTTRTKAKAEVGRINAEIEALQASARADGRAAVAEARRVEADNAELLRSLMEKIRWHHEQIGMQLNAVDGHGDVLNNLAETADDGRHIWALCEALVRALSPVDSDA